MKLVRFGSKGLEKPGVLDDAGAIRDVSAHISDFGGHTVGQEALDALRSVDLASCPVVEGDPRIGQCLIDAPNFFCIGLNYKKHAEESGMKIPEVPVIFMKATSCLSGPNDDVLIPAGSEQTDWEVELGVVIGKAAHHVSEADALSHVAGYCVINDVSERSYQFSDPGGQWIRGKSCPSFGPIGPYLVTADEIPDPQALNCWLSVNGETVQNSNTSDMIFSVAEIISYMSRYMTLRPGDVIATGTPEGVGFGFDPKRFLTPGDRVALGIEGLGEQHQTVAAAG